jgi:putative spermidine/putrescine transport system substrate-binding protein
MSANIRLSRRRFLKTTAATGLAVGAGSLGMPAVRAAGGQVVVRGLGGAYQDAMAAAIYKPFTAATGVEVVVQPATAAQVRAMVEAKRVSMDVIDLVDIALFSLDKIGALEPIDYASMSFSNPDDLQPTVRRPNMAGNLYFATVLTYNTEVFKPDTHPRSWAEFWNTTKFAGARTLADQKSGAAEFEFALLADGVARDKLYPIDLDRAFASLDKIKGSVVKWWDTGAVSAELLERKEAVVGGIWNGRAQALIDKGAPLAIEWNEAKQQVQYWGIVKGAPNAANAQKFIDFALQPKVQGELTRYIAYGPTNKKAFEFVRDDDRAKLPSLPEHFAQSFEQDPEWWLANLSGVGQRWQSWVLSR